MKGAEHREMNMLIIWLIAIAAFAILEALTYQLVCVWFAIGAIGGFLAAYAGGSLNLQISVFLVISIIMLCCLRPLSMRWIKKNKPKEKLNTLIGKCLYVSKDIDEDMGEGKLNGVMWSLKSADGEKIEKGALVEIVEVEGVKLIVKRSTKQKEEEQA